MPWPSKIAINFGGGAGAGDGDNIYSAFQQVQTKFNAIVDTGLASSATTITGTDTTQPVHSAGVAAAITARTPAAFMEWFDSLPTDPTGLSVGDWFNNSGVPCRVEA